MLFRGLPNGNERDFSEFVNKLGYEPFSYVGGTAPRDELAENVDEGSHDDNFLSIEPHNEMSYALKFPKVKLDRILWQGSISWVVFLSNARNKCETKCDGQCLLSVIMRIL